MERLTCVISFVNKIGSHVVGVEFYLEIWFGMDVDGSLDKARVFRRLTAVCITIVARYKLGVSPSCLDAHYQSGHSMLKYDPVSFSMVIIVGCFVWLKCIYDCEAGESFGSFSEVKLP